MFVVASRAWAERDTEALLSADVSEICQLDSALDVVLVSRGGRSNHNDLTAGPTHSGLEGVAQSTALKELC